MSVRCPPSQQTTGCRRSMPCRAKSSDARAVSACRQECGSSMARPAAVIGGGISGLASAGRLAARGYTVTLYESETFLGGLGTTFPYRDGHLERFYHCILPDDAHLVAWIRELGLEGELLW